MTDLAKLLPPSIADDEIMAAAANAAGAEEEKVRGDISKALIWSRINELDEPILDHLCWALHIDGWEYADGVEKKRWLIKHFYDWHRLKGTEAGLEMFLRVLLGRKLLKVVPPHKDFWGEGPTPEARRAFESIHPDLRIYAWRTKAPVGMAGFCGHSAWGHAAWVDLNPVYQAGLKFELHDPLTSEVKELKPVYSHPHQVVRWARGEIQAAVPGKVGMAGFCGHSAWGHAAWVDLKPEEKLYTFNPNQPFVDTSAESRLAKPALIPMDTAYTETSDREPVGMAGFCGHSAWGHAAWVNLKPEENLYKSVRLFDPVRARNLGGGVGGKQFWGHGRWGSPPAHTAHAHVEVIYKINGASAWGQRAWSQLHAWTENDAETPIKQVCHVVRLNMRASDRIKLITQNHRPLRCGPGIKCGRHKCGQYVRETI